MGNAIATVSSAADEPQDCHWWDDNRYECGHKAAYIVDTPDRAAGSKDGKRWAVCDRHTAPALFEARVYMFTGR